VDAAPAPQRSAAGLPVRKPRATGITEYREFEDAPSTAPEAAPDKSGARSDAPAAKGRLSWLPGRAKAAAEAARAEAESEEPRQMPSNLSAWLDHRAKLVEASKARELGVDAPAAEGETAAQSDTSPTSSETESTTAMHVPEAWVAEAADAEAADRPSDPSSDQAPVAEALPELDPHGDGGAAVHESAEAVSETSAPVDSIDVVEAPVAGQDETTALPTRVPGATSAPAVQAVAGGATSARPAMRAHNTSFFGARRARDTVAAAPMPEQPAATAEVASTESVVDEVTEPVTTAVEEAIEVVALQEPVTEAAQDSTGADGIQESSVGTPEAAEDTIELLASTEPEGVDDSVEQPTSVVEVSDDVVENVPDAEVHAEVHADVDAESVPHAEADVDADSVVHSEVHADTHAEPVVEQERAPRTADLNDTPIFRAMMSRWLTDDSSVPASASWSTNEADQAWSAAARIEETQPLEESAVGLPMRRPGSFLIPGAVDESDQKPAAPAAPRRDPEAIRRNLNRHKNGVSSARTEAQDGTHREEADVHH
jgi:hypothetical protein